MASTNKQDPTSKTEPPTTQPQAPSQTQSIPLSTIYRPSSPFKRSFSPEPKESEASKRQRLEAATSAARVLENDDFMRILAQATASTSAQIEKNRPIASPVTPVAQPATPKQNAPAPVPAPAKAQTPHVQVQPQAAPPVAAPKPQRAVQAPYVPLQHPPPPPPPLQNGRPPMAVEGNTFHLIRDPYVYMRVLSLPILESLSTQILARLALEPLADAIRLFSEPQSEQAQAYTTLKTLFQSTKKIYGSSDFLSADQLALKEDINRHTIRLTNVTTFAASVFSGQDVGFHELHNNFINVFCPENQPLIQEVGIMYLDLKTQMYIASASSEDQARSKEELLDDLYSLDPQASLDPLRSRPSRPLIASEIEFMNAVRLRRTFLREQPYSPESIQDLSETFPWEGFLQKLTMFLKRNYEPLITPYMKRFSLPIPVPPPPPVRSIEHDISAETERAIQAALLSISSASAPSPPLPQQQSNGTSQPTEQQNSTQVAPSTTQPFTAAVPFPTQSAPTQVLYERARQAAAAKSLPLPTTVRRPGLASQRRPWTTEEENALMTGLDQVKGPHWSQILSLYGTNGTVSDILKERNQVQLKDKARNLKLFFLKSNIEVPYYLQSVTGELKTRAPGQAARREAEENGVNGGIKDENGGTEVYFEDEEFVSEDEVMGDGEAVLVKEERDPDEVLRESLLAANAAVDGVNGGN